MSASAMSELERLMNGRRSAPLSAAESEAFHRKMLEDLAVVQANKTHYRSQPPAPHGSWVMTEGAERGQVNVVVGPTILSVMNMRKFPDTACYCTQAGMEEPDVVECH